MRTDIVYDRIELGLVPCGEEDIEARSSELNRKLASNAVRRARNDYHSKQGGNKTALIIAHMP
jgi:hypothetical protein